MQGLELQAGEEARNRGICIGLSATGKVREIGEIPSKIGNKEMIKKMDTEEQLQTFHEAPNVHARA